MNILINGLTEGIIPPLKYGGIERVNAFLVKGLLDLGFDPVLICREGSTIDCRKLVCANPARAGAQLVAIAEARYGYFDIIHDNSASGAVLQACRESHPVFWTVHGPGVDDELSAYLSQGSTYGYDATSGRNLPYTHLGIDLSLYDPCWEAEDYIVFLGQIRRHKYLHFLTAIAQAYNLRAIVIAPHDATCDEEYLWENFNDYPFAWVAGADDATKCQYIRKAKCLVHCSEPTEWADASPMGVLEALALGTTVIGNYSGGIPEMIQDGVTGFLVSTEAEAIKAYATIDQIDRQACRRYMEQERSHTLFAKRMLVIYEGLANLPYVERCIKIRKLQFLIDKVSN